MLRNNGVVISGGGARGAYSFGFLKTLQDSGIKFEAASGTSVGALNGIILSTGCYDEGFETWKTITQDRVLPFAAPMIVSGLILALSVIPNSFYRFKSGLPPLPEDWSVLNKILKGLFGSTTVFPIFALILGAFYSSPDRGHLPMAPRVLFFSIFILFLYPNSSTEMMVRTGVIQASWYLPPAFIILKLVQDIYYRDLHWLPFFGWALIPTLIAIYYRIIRRLTEHWQLLSNSPLKEHLRAFLSHDLTIPTYVTVGVKTYLFDPDDPEPSIAMTYGSMYVPSRYYYDEKTGYRAEYLPLHKMQTLEDKINAGLATAALPFGLIAEVKLADKTCVDGGVVDNIPIWPLIQLENCKQILVIHHKPIADDQVADRQVKEHNSDLIYWQSCRRSVDLRAFPAPDVFGYKYESRSDLPYTLHNQPPTHVPVCQPIFWPENIWHHYPSRPLGGLLAFRPKHMRALIRLGKEDAIKFLKSEAVRPFLCSADA